MLPSRVMSLNRCGITRHEILPPSLFPPHVDHRRDADLRVLRGVGSDEAVWRAANSISGVEAIVAIFQICRVSLFTLSVRRVHRGTNCDRRNSVRLFSRIVRISARLLFVVSQFVLKAIWRSRNQLINVHGTLGEMWESPKDCSDQRLEFRGARRGNSTLRWRLRLL